MPQLSIIVPVYKVEKYLPKCIESILNQTFSDFELILIDDGSPDHCGTICDEYASKDSRIKVIHQANAGVSAARNAGLDIASGTFLGFVDSDDWIDPEMYTAMISAAVNRGADIVICGIQHFDEMGRFLYQELLSSGDYQGFELMASLYAMPNPLGGCIWNKIYRRECVADIRYSEGVSMAEDRIYLFDCYSRCSLAIKLADVFNAITDWPGSATHRQHCDVPYNMIMGSKMLLDRASIHSKELEGKAIDKFLDDCIVHIREINRIKKEQGRQNVTMITKCKALMAQAIFRAWRKRLLPMTKIRGYIMSLLRL